MCPNLRINISFVCAQTGLINKNFESSCVIIRRRKEGTKTKLYVDDFAERQLFKQNSHFLLIIIFAFSQEKLLPLCVVKTRTNMRELTLD